MIDTLGFVNWQQRTIHGGPIVFAGYVFADCIATLRASKGPSGAVVPMLAGGFVYQQTLAMVGAPLDVEPETLSLHIEAGIEEDYHRVKMLHSIAAAQAIPFFFPDPVTDLWPIPGTAKTSWTLSRSTPYGIASVPFLDFEPVAWIMDFPTAATETALSIVTTGTPGATEVLVDSAVSGISIETADLSAEATRVLAFRYHALRLCRVKGVSRAFVTTNGLEYDVELEEVVPAREY